MRDYENSDKGYILEVDVKYPKRLLNSHRDLPFLPKRRKIRGVEKLICSTEDKEKYPAHTRNLKRALNHGSKLKEVHKVIKFNQKAWLKKYIDKNTNLRKKAKNEFEKDSFQLMNNFVFGKTMANVRNHRDIKLVTTERRRRSQLVSQPNYHTTKHFSENLLAMEMKKMKVTMNKPIYLGEIVLDISKTNIYEFWCDFIKAKYGDRAKLCYADTDSLIPHIKTEYFFEDIDPDVDIWFNTSNYDENGKRPLPTGENKRVPGLYKDELGGKNIKEVCALRGKTWSFLRNDGSEIKKAKRTKKL